MENIIAVVDCQGFQFKNRFVPREIAIVGKFFSQCQELNTNINWKELPDDEQAIILYTTRFKNRLHFNPFNPVDSCFLPNTENIGDILKTWYQMYLNLSGNEKIQFAFKNEQMGKILKENLIPNFDLNSISDFPNYKTIAEKYGSNYLCAYHKKPPRYCTDLFICAYRKSCHLYREIQEFFERHSDWNTM